MICDKCSADNPKYWAWNRRFEDWVPMCEGCFEIYRPEKWRLIDEKKTLAPENIIKCAFCDWQIPRWLTNKKGKHIESFTKLQSHVALHHWDEYEKVIEKLEE
uniref:Uncharacterized protein n=1 Tax=viral metagenome TaxID=1070528 RepID=A0A6M3L9H5_9ZZZZ